MARFPIQLKNSSVELPNDVGTYVLSTGCGSGKTYWLVRFTRQHYNDGMLLVVDSIVSANNLYCDLKDLGVPEDDILMIHSKTDFGVMDEYSRSPENVTKKKVIIITNVRLYTEYPPVYLLYNANGVALSCFDGDWQKLMTNPNIRRWIFIDEIPGFIQHFATVSKIQLGVLSDSDGQGGYKPKSEAEMKRAYNTFLNNSGNRFFDGSTALGELKVDSVLAMIRRNYSKMFQSQTEYNIQFSPCDLKSPNCLTLIMEGAGDILFKDSTVFTPIDNPAKYKGKVVFQSFNISKLKRKDTDKKMLSRIATALVYRMSRLKSKSLIVCWKDLKGGDDLEQSNNNENLDEMLKTELAKAKLPENSYSVIYYGSSYSRAVNDFKDYKNIFLVGNWSLATSQSSSLFKKIFRTQTTLYRYMLWEYVQLITRIRIRLNQDITVYYTSDHKKDFIESLSKYFNKNRLAIPEEQDDWRDKIRNVSYGKSQLDSIEKLAQRYKSIPETIRKPKQETINISLKELNKILKTHRSLKRFNPLTEVLRNFGITLIINK